MRACEISQLNRMLTDDKPNLPSYPPTHFKPHSTFCPFFDLSQPSPPISLSTNHSPPSYCTNLFFPLNNKLVIPHLGKPPDRCTCIWNAIFILAGNSSSISTTTSICSSNSSNGCCGDSYSIVSNRTGITAISISRNRTLNCNKFLKWLHVVTQ